MFDPGWYERRAREDLEREMESAFADDVERDLRVMSQEGLSWQEPEPETDLRQHLMDRVDERRHTELAAEHAIEDAQAQAEAARERGDEDLARGADALTRMIAAALERQQAEREFSGEDREAAREIDEPEAGWARADERAREVEATLDEADRSRQEPEISEPEQEIDDPEL